MTAKHSIDDLRPFCLQSRNAVLHRLQSLRRMPFPRLHLADHPQRLSRAIRLRRIAGEFLVRQVGVVDEGAGRLDYIDALPPVALRQLRALDRRIQRRGEIDPRHRLPCAVVRGVSHSDEVAGSKICPRAVIEDPRGIVVGGCLWTLLCKSRGVLLDQPRGVASSPTPG